MKKIFLSLLTIVAVFSLVLVGSQAFFSDTETSEGNILQAGALDLKVDNTCYYNGNACVDGHFVNTEEACSCTWQSDDLSEQDVLFSFRDLKPGDWEEDTLSFNVENDAWVCADLDLTSNLDNSITEPEDEADALPGNNSDGTVNGDLAGELEFIFWNDDGDNVHEVDEKVLTSGLASEVLDSARWAIADSSTGRPGLGGQAAYVGKAFCFGNLTASPLAQRAYTGPNVDNDVDTDVDPQDGGILCDGKLVGNISQTDSLGGNVVFYAEQARHNEGFLCNPPTPTPTQTPTPTLAPSPTGPQ